MQSFLMIDGDIVFENGDFVMVEGTEELAQCCQVILGTNKGEWFLDPDAGIDFAKFNGRHPDPEEMREEIRAGLFQEPRTQTVEEITIAADKRARQLAVSFAVTGSDNETVTGEVPLNVG